MNKVKLQLISKVTDAKNTIRKSVRENYANDIH